MAAAAAAAVEHATATAEALKTCRENGMRVEHAHAATAEQKPTEQAAPEPEPDQTPNP